MTVYRVTFGFQNSIYGATETYYSREFGTVASFCDSLAFLIDKRNELVNVTTNWVGVRISQYSGAGVNRRRRSKLFPPGTYKLNRDGFSLVVPAVGGYDTVALNSKPDQSRACLQIRLTYDTDRSVMRYLAFVPDNVLYGEPASVQLDKNVVWQSRYNIFVDRVTNGDWQLQARRTGGVYDPQPIREWVQAAVAPLNLGVAIPAASALPAGIGDKIHVKNSRRKGTDKLSYNGKYYVAGVNTTLSPDNVIYYLRGTESGDASSVKLLGTVEPVAYQLYVIQGITPLRAGVHKRGKPFTTPLGRRKTRVSLDP
jgi:hypothetical protein